jgi:hypothetical protein
MMIAMVIKGYVDKIKGNGVLVKRSSNLWATAGIMRYFDLGSASVLMTVDYRRPIISSTI